MTGGGKTWTLDKVINTHGPKMATIVNTACDTVKKLSFCYYQLCNSDVLGKKQQRKHFKKINFNKLSYRRGTA